MSMFWHFLDVVWIAVFTFVYLMGSHLLCATRNTLVEPHRLHGCGDQDHDDDHGGASHSTFRASMTGFVLAIMTAIRSTSS
jgi:hypothetical protein